MYYTCVLKSQKDKKLYVGFTQNVEKRLEQHNQGQVVPTKSRRPFILIYYEACLNKQKARHREKYFKTDFGRRFLKDRL